VFILTDKMTKFRKAQLNMIQNITNKVKVFLLCSCFCLCVTENDVLFYLVYTLLKSTFSFYKTYKLFHKKGT